MSEVFGTAIDLWPVTIGVAAVVLFLGLKKLTGNLRIFVLMIAGSIVGFFVSVVLHNAIYAIVLVKLLDMPDSDEPVFFVIAVIVCPIVLAVGVVGALVTWLRERRLR